MKKYAKITQVVKILFRLIKHTERFVEDEEGLCIQVLQHLRNMVERETRFGRKVGMECDCIMILGVVLSYGVEFLQFTCII